ncbi:hypothetical protein ACFE04_019652 [Oxalis oulophora]
MERPSDGLRFCDSLRAPSPNGAFTPALKSYCFKFICLANASLPSIITVQSGEEALLKLSSSIGSSFIWKNGSSPVGESPCYCCFKYIYPIPACPAAHAVPTLILDVALSEVAEDSIDAPVLSAAVVDALYFLVSQCSCLV